MRIETFILPFFSENNDNFADSIVVFIDVLRASTTICAALHNGAKEVIPAESMDRSLLLYSTLSRETRHLAGEINGIMPKGFDSGNSPLEFSYDRISGKSIVLSTTNGTRLINKVKHGRYRIIASFVNLSAVVDFINQNHDLNLNIFCAGNNGQLSFEDALCAGAIIDELNIPGIVLNDSSFACKSLFNRFRSDLNTIITESEHAKHLHKIGLSDDISFALRRDSYPVIPILNGNCFRKLNNG
jgi:2-phosphosulfolactate phosphatase